MNITLKKVDIGETKPVTGLILFHRANEVHLLLSRGTGLSESSQLARGGGPVRLVPAGDLGGNGGGSWDAKPAAGQGAAFVTCYLRPESAVTWAMLRRPDGSEDRRLHLEPFAVYDHPRFVKGQRPDQWTATAVKYVDGDSIPVVFSNLADGAALPVSKPIGNYHSIRDARLLQDGTAYWLFLLMRVPNAFPDPKLRELPRGAQMPAILHMVHVNAGFEPTGKITEVFGSLPIYEFEVDVAPNGHIVVFGTTPGGAVFASGIPQEGKPLPRDGWEETKFQQPLVSPSILVQGRRVHLAAIANLAKNDASVLYGTVPP
jgi:hypothetical protein